MAETKINLICETCGKLFERRIGEHNRSLRLGRKAYCGYSCSSKRPDNISHIKSVQGPHEHLLQHKYNRLDEYSPFKWHLKNARARKKECSITLIDLKEQWDKQNGICPYTGWELKNHPSTGNIGKQDFLPDRASLDRIDSDKGYTKDNIQFISLIAQYGKHKFTEKQFLQFLKDCAKHIE